MTEEIRFEDLPRVTQMMMTKLEELCAKMDKIIPTAEEPIDRWFTVDELREYLPEHPARQTVYGWTSNAIIPFHKKGKSLRFRKSEVDKWLHEGYIFSFELFCTYPRHYFFFAGEMETFYAKRNTMFAENVICINAIDDDTIPCAYRGMIGVM